MIVRDMVRKMRRAKIIPITKLDKVWKPSRLANSSRGLEKTATKRMTKEIRYQSSEYLAEIRPFFRINVVIINRKILKMMRKMMSSNDIFDTSEF